MTPDTADTIVAIATASGGSERGVVRLSGFDALVVVSRVLGDPLALKVPRRLPGRSVSMPFGGAERSVPADVLVWPDERSYTHQPSVELHTIGSPPVLDAIVRACVKAGARLAEPGEFTLRAFLAGRLDLTQAEAVLSVIDATDEDALNAALERLAGGLATPLHRLRADLLDLLADLEAGLDFVEEEGVRFIEPKEVSRRLAEAIALVSSTADQLDDRGDAERLPTVALVGPPNVGKSRLFNALVERFGVEPERPKSLVADAVGVTRDTLAAVVDLDGLRMRLVDTAGDDEGVAIDAIDRTARDRLSDVLRDADLLAFCHPAGAVTPPLAEARLGVLTMADLADSPTPAGWLATSAATGTGFDRLAAAILERLLEAGPNAGGLAGDRSRVGLADAQAALTRAATAAGDGSGDELVSFELREALDGLGRVVGEVVTDEVLGEIFGKFCIGK